MCRNSIHKSMFYAIVLEIVKKSNENVEVNQFLSKFFDIKEYLFDSNGKSDEETLVINFIKNNIFIRGDNSFSEIINIVLVTFIFDISYSYMDLTSLLTAYNFENLNGQINFEVLFSSTNNSFTVKSKSFTMINLEDFLKKEYKKILNSQKIYLVLADFILKREIGQVFTTNKFFNFKSMAKFYKSNNKYTYSSSRELSYFKTLICDNSINVSSRNGMDFDGLYFFSGFCDFLEHLKMNFKFEINFHTRPLNMKHVIINERIVRLKSLNYCHLGKLSTSHGFIYLYLFSSLYERTRNDFIMDIENMCVKINDIILKYKNTFPFEVSKYEKERNLFKEKNNFHIYESFKYILSKELFDNYGLLKKDYFIYGESYGSKYSTLNLDFNSFISSLNHIIDIKFFNHLYVDVAMSKYKTNNDNNHIYVSVNNQILNRLGNPNSVYITLLNNNLANLNVKLVTIENKKVLHVGYINKLNLYNPTISYITGKKSKRSFGPFNTLLYFKDRLTGKKNASNKNLNSINNLLNILEDDNLTFSEYRCELTTNMRSLIPASLFLCNFVVDDDNFVFIPFVIIKNEIVSKLKMFLFKFDGDILNINIFFQHIISEIVLTHVLFKGCFNIITSIDKNLCDDLKKVIKTDKTKFPDISIVIDNFINATQPKIKLNIILNMLAKFKPLLSKDNNINSNLFDKIILMLESLNIDFFAAFYFDQYINAITEKFFLNIEILQEEMQYKTTNLPEVTLDDILLDILKPKYNFLKSLKIFVDMYFCFYTYNNPASYTSYFDQLKECLKSEISKKQISYFPVFHDKDKYRIVKIISLEYLKKYSLIAEDIRNLKKHIVENNKCKTVSWPIVDSARLLIGYKMYRQIYPNQTRINIIKLVENDIRFGYFGRKTTDQLNDKIKNLKKFAIRNLYFKDELIVRINNFAVKDIFDLTVSKFKKIYNINTSQYDFTIIKLIALYSYKSLNFIGLNVRYENLESFLNSKNSIEVQESWNTFLYQKYCDEKIKELDAHKDTIIQSGNCDNNMPIGIISLKNNSTYKNDNEVYTMDIPNYTINEEEYKKMYKRFDTYEENKFTINRFRKQFNYKNRPSKEKAKEFLEYLVTLGDLGKHIGLDGIDEYRKLQ